MFLLIYFILSAVLTYLIFLLFEKKSIKWFTSILFFSLAISFWFKFPGSEYLAPVTSILLLEATITESNGILRLLRPFALSIISCLIILLVVKSLLRKIKKK